MMKPNWEAWKFLLGEWTGEGGGQPGQGVGGMSFEFDLEGQVLVRRNHVDYPATPDRPAFVHDDLTIVHPDPSGGLRAQYFDNEGHVIQYAVSAAEDAIVLISDPDPTAPRFRTSYLKEPGGAVTTRFEIAPPGKPEEFALYVEGLSRRKKVQE